MTDAELINGYLEDLKWRNLSKNTVDIRRIYLRHLSKSLGPFGTIKSKALRAWLADEDRDLDPASQSTYLSTFHSFFGWAIRNGHLKKDPTLKIDKPKVPKGEPHPITDESLEKALVNADAKMRCWLSLGAFAGLRCQEIALMGREDVRDDESMRLFVSHGKGSKQRWTPLHPKILEALTTWGMPESGRLWDLNPAQMSKAINAYLHDRGAKRVDGEAATAHSLRHYFGSKVYQASKDLRLTQILMGHASPQTTSGYVAADMSGAAGIVGSL